MGINTKQFILLKKSLPNYLDTYRRLHNENINLSLIGKFLSLK